MRLGKPGDAVSTSGSVMRQIINEQLQISESNPIKARYYDYDRFTLPLAFPQPVRNNLCEEKAAAVALWAIA